MRVACFFLPYAVAFPTRHASNAHRQACPTNLAAFSNVLEASASFANFFKPSQATNAQKFLIALNENRIDDAMAVLDEEVEFLDTAFPSPFQGKDELERILRLGSNLFPDRFVVDDVAFDSKKNKIGILFHMEGDDGTIGKLGNSIFELDKTSDLITNVFLSKENSKSGEANLKILKAASQIIALSKKSKSPSSNAVLEPKMNGGSELMPSLFQKANRKSSLSLPEQYFQAWNERDIDKACTVFDDNVEYDDTAFPAPFVGRENLNAHLKTCVECFPSSMSFVVDETVDGVDNFMVRWHAENNGEELPFTKGCSFYKVKGGKIIKGVDVVEPAVFKTGGLSLLSNSILAEPIRLVPLAVWAVYMYVVFFSDWFFGLPVTALEQRTWEEVRDLSLNFFFVSPILNLPFSPVVHPMMEGVFNLLLSWAAMFAGFLSDERRDKPNLLPMLPTVAGMQFLTSAFLLPFLATRSNEHSSEVYCEDLPVLAQATESPVLGLSMAGVGSGAIFWALFARAQDFGGWGERLPSFLQILSIDRVGSSFLVDLVIFALFQGWLVDDDLKRRNMASDTLLAKAAKLVPFFGMAVYLTFRTPLPQRVDDNL
jgi:ketosteroid isomerase-like protein